MGGESFELLDFWADHIGSVLGGLGLTIRIWVICAILGTVAGCVVGVCRVYGGKTLYFIATAYVEFFRGTPLLVQMFMIHFGLPEIGIVFSPVTSAVIAITLNTSAYQSEYFRGAIQSIDVGQRMAAETIGLTPVKVIRFVILPQAVRIVVPQWINEVTMIFLETSLAFTIGVIEIVGQSKIIGFQTFRYFEIFALAGVIYFVCVATLATGLDYLAKKVQLPGTARMN
jgi:polar amino acid transport system permease protein